MKVADLQCYSIIQYSNIILPNFHIVTRNMFERWKMGNTENEHIFMQESHHLAYSNTYSDRIRSYYSNRYSNILSRLPMSYTHGVCRYAYIYYSNSTRYLQRHIDRQTCSMYSNMHVTSNIMIQLYSTNQGCIYVVKYFFESVVNEVGACLICT